MREQKYAHILEEYEEELKKIQEKSVEDELEDEIVEEDLEDEDEKMSMTREIKYKDLQEVIDKKAPSTEEETTNRISELKEDLAEVEDILDKTDHLAALEKMAAKDEESEDEEVEPEEDKEESKEESEVEETESEEEPNPENTDIKIKQVSGKSPLEDIYLTTSFQPFVKRFKARNIIFFFLKLIIICAIIGAIGYFVVYPVINYYVMSRPEKIFDNTIDYVAEQLIENRNSGDNHNIYLNINSDKMLIQLLNGFNISFQAQNMEINNNASTDLYQIKLDGQNLYYQKTTTEEIKQNKKNLSDTDYKYIVNKTSDILKELIVKEKLERVKDEIEVNGKKTSVYRNTFTIDQKTAEELTKKYYEEISKDRRLVEYLAEFNNMSSSAYKDYLSKQKITYPKDYKAAINIYTTKKGQVVGFDFEKNSFRTFYIYFNQDDFNMYLNLADIKTCKDQNTCQNNGLILEVNGTKKDNKSTIDVKYNNKQLANFTLDNYKLFN